MAEHYISKKISWFRCLVSFLLSAGAAALVCLFLAGPRLGFLYDLLLAQRSPLVAREILLIDSTIPGEELGNGILDPTAASSLLYTMAELGARTLIIQVPILGLPAGGAAAEAEIIHRFDEEFSLLSGNIRNLFEAIRIGSIAPVDSARYVGMLVELSEMGKERLVSALIRRDEESITRMEEAAAFFGDVRRPGDIQVQLIMAGGGGQPGVLAERYEYSRPRPDRDGVLRRVAPALTLPYFLEEGIGEITLEHIIYSALKDRLGLYTIAEVLPLDRGGAVLFEIPRRETFRRISIVEFLAYEEADRELRRLIQEGDALGIFHNIPGENRPGFLHDHALSLRGGDELNRLAWIAARNRYFESLDNFFHNRTETEVIPGRQEIIAALQTTQEEVLELRQRLESALSDSFCILGHPADTEASALFANSILTGRAVTPGDELYLFLGALFAALLTCLFIKSQGPALTLGIGTLLTLFFGMAFSAAFIFSGYWFDPQVPMAASGMGVLVSFIWASAAKTRHNRSFRLAYGQIVSAPCLRSVMLAGKPLPSQTVTVKAAVVAIRNSAPLSRQDVPGSPTVSQQVLSFQGTAADLVRKAGGTIIGTEGDIVTACFGSPLERVFSGNKKTPSPYEDTLFAPPDMALNAADFVSNLVRNPKFASWHFGLHMGNCTFLWTPISGFFALGIPVQRAKILSRLTGRYQARIIISASINEALPDMVGKRLGILKENDGSESEHFYKLSDNV